VARGGSNLDIAGELGLRPDTVKAYLRSGMRKLDVHNRTAAVHVARARGLLHPPRDGTESAPEWPRPSEQDFTR
jgi:hypothetical protein